MSCKLSNWVNRKRSVRGDLPHPHTAATPQYGTNQAKKAGGGSRPKHGESIIPKGDAPLPGVSTEDLRKMHAELTGRKNVGKKTHILAAAIKWREELGVSEIARQIMQPYSTVYNWLVRLRDRGLEGISDGTAPNRKPILGEVACLVIGVWLSHAPQAYGPESGLWQASMLRKMILDRLGMDIRPGTLRGTMKRMNYSLRMLREAPHKSADPPDVQKVHRRHPEEVGRPGQVGVRQLLPGRDDHAAVRHDKPEMAADAAAAKR